MKPRPGQRKLSTREALEATADAERLKETNQVAAQPHRRGDRGDMTDSLGKFVISQGCDRACYEAGQAYIGLVAKWRHAKGVPSRERILSDVAPTGNGPNEAAVEKWEEEINSCDNAMKRVGLPGFRAARSLILDDQPPEFRLFAPVRRAIEELARHLVGYTG